jgi:hypothetical protein
MAFPVPFSLTGLSPLSSVSDQVPAAWQLWVAGLFVGCGFCLPCLYFSHTNNVPGRTFMLLALPALAQAVIMLHVRPHYLPNYKVFSSSLALSFAPASPPHPYTRLVLLFILWLPISWCFVLTCVLLPLTLCIRLSRLSQSGTFAWCGGRLVCHWPDWYVYSP